MINDRPKVKIFAILALCATLAACATPTPYQPAVNYEGGYRTQQIGPDHYLITFTGNEVTPRETVETYLLYRAAQVTLNSGHDYFIVVRRDTQRDTDYWVTSDPFWADPFWGGPWGWGPWGWGPYSYYTTSVTSLDSYKAFADIAVRKGRKPEGMPNAYDARGIVNTLGPAILQAARTGSPVVRP